MTDYNSQFNVVDSKSLSILRNQAHKSGSFTTIDPVQDYSWGIYSEQLEQGRNPYFDYYFSGQDIKAYIAELGDDNDYGKLPLVAMGFNMTQEKTPVYGAWSYVYDSVMRGRRLVTGTMAFATKEPDYMRRALAKSAKNRSDRHNRNLSDKYPAASQLTEDDKNIEEYWGRNIDSSLAASGKNEFSVHPPFSLIVVYGRQSATVEGRTQYEYAPGEMGSLFGDSPYFGNYSEQNALHQTHNHRLVERGSEKPTRIVLDACELQDVSREYTPDGNVLIETYSFFARDMLFWSAE